MLEARELAAARGSNTLFSGISFSLDKGTLLRVTGSNGSGKTTLLRTLCGLRDPAAGTVCWNGEAVRAMREEYARQLVYIGHASALKNDLTAAENLAFSCQLAGRATAAPDIAAALHRFGLSTRSRLPVRELSQGQRRRAGLARLALAADQPLWILDEPFAALDASAVELVRNIAAAHLARGGIVALTTHQGEDVAAPRVAQLNLDEPER